MGTGVNGVVLGNSEQASKVMFPYFHFQRAEGPSFFVVVVVLHDFMFLKKSKNTHLCIN